MGLTGLSVKLADILPTITLFLSGNLYTLGDSAKRPAIRPFSFESVRLLIEPGFGDIIESDSYLFTDTKDSYSIDMFLRYLGNLSSAQVIT